MEYSKTDDKLDAEFKKTHSKLMGDKSPTLVSPLLQKNGSEPLLHSD